MYTPTKWSTAAGKQKFHDHFIRFVEKGYKRTLFYEWFYKRLSMCFGFIAHYNIDGFYSTYFTTPAGIRDFETIIRNCPCYGQATHTYCDVEKDLKQYMIDRHEQLKNVPQEYRVAIAVLVTALNPQEAMNRATHILRSSTDPVQGIIDGSRYCEQRS